MSSLHKLADDLSEASGALAAWTPDSLAEALRLIGLLPDLTRDLTFMWERLAEHADASGYLHPAVTARLRDIAALSVTQEQEADAVLNRFPRAQNWR
jgi:hypothetical protein